MNRKCKAEEIKRFFSKEYNLFGFFHAGINHTLLYEIETLDNNQYENLLPLSAQSELHEVSPFIIQLDINSSFTEWLLKDDLLMKDAFFLASKLSIKLLSEKFKNLILCFDNKNEPYYFCYYINQVFVDYLVFLKNFDPKQCKGLFEDVIFFVFEKNFFVENYISRSNNCFFYLPLYENDYLNNTALERKKLENIIDERFFLFFSKQRISRYKNYMYETLCNKYPQSLYSKSDKNNVMLFMDDFIQKSLKHEITNEKAIGNLIEISWFLDRSVFESNIAQNILSQRSGQIERTTTLLNIAKDYYHG